jgi:hypothetical protein
MDVYVHRAVEAKFTLDEEELYALRDLVALAQEYVDSHLSSPLTEAQAKVAGHVMQAYERVR